MTLHSYLSQNRRDLNQFIKRWKAVSFHQQVQQFKQYKNDEFQYLFQENLNTGKLNEIHTNFKKKYTSLSRDIGVLYSELKELIGLCKELQKNCPLRLDAITKKLNDMYSALNSGFNVANNSYLFSFMKFAVQVEDEIDNISGFIGIYDNYIQTNKGLQASENEKTLAIEFGTSSQVFTDFIENMKLIFEIYDEFKQLLQLGAEADLRYSKIESGSALFELLGDGKILDFIKWLFTALGGYVYRNFTNEGRILTIPKQIEALDSIANLSAKLREFDSPVLNKYLDESDEHAAKSIAVISKKSEILIRKSNKIMLDGETIGVQESEEERFLEESKRLLIEQHTDNSTPSDIIE